MEIRRKRVLNPNRYLAFLEEGQEFYVSYKVTDSSVDLLSEVGFKKPYVAGHIILPAILGPISRRNSEGVFVY